MSGLLSPDPRLRELSDLGLVQAGALLHTYVSGTPSTPLATYTTDTLGVAHANPVVASAGGLFPAIYLTPGLAYKYVLTDALGNALWDQDPVLAPIVVDPTRLLAADGTVALSVNATHVLNSATQPRCSAFHNTTQSVPDAAYQVLLLNSEDYDVGTLHDLVTNTSRLTIPVGGDGLYLVHGKTRYPGVGAGSLYNVAIYKNGALVREKGYTGTHANVADHEITAQLTLVAGDYLELATFQNSGGAILTGNATRYASTELQVVKLW